MYQPENFSSGEGTFDSWYINITNKPIIKYMKYTHHQNIDMDLSNNHLQDSGAKLISAGLRSSNCKLKKLGVEHGGKTRIKQGLTKYKFTLFYAHFILSFI
ncbi:hypothetical protein NFI96_025813 [Prochilodus magdalenae]|nr:hypothetical protein NFI96_025813 [Prochilodus magdalenae]